jgi:hypothetical protein
VVLEAVDDVESLSTGLSRKIWQKVMILGQIQAIVGGMGTNANGTDRGLPAPEKHYE